MRSKTRRSRKRKSTRTSEEQDKEEEDPLETLKKTPSASEEIFERKGWNTMDGSWRNPFDFD